MNCNAANEGKNKLNILAWVNGLTYVSLMFLNMKMMIVDKGKHKLSIWISVVQRPTAKPMRR